MARDYARQRKNPKPPQRQQQRANEKNGWPSWLWALVGLTLGLAVAASIFIIYRPVEAVVVEPAKVTPPTAPPGPAIPPATEPRFKFYNGLRDAEVRPSEQAYTVEKVPQAELNNYRYLIQAGSFKARADAERRRANLALLGVESSVQQVEVKEKGTHYRVQIGPGMSYENAEKIMRQLADNQIDSFATRVQG